MKKNIFWGLLFLLVALGPAEAVRSVYRGERRVAMREPDKPHKADRPARSRGE